MDKGVHKHAEHEAWLDEQLKKHPNKRSTARMLLPPASLFWHGSFRSHRRYPNGLAELAGYWAETQIFGGVILFDRGESGEEVSLSAATMLQINRALGVIDQKRAQTTVQRHVHT
jgi:hypothetical protein